MLEIDQQKRVEIEVLDESNILEAKVRGFGLQSERRGYKNSLSVTWKSVVCRWYSKDLKDALLAGLVRKWQFFWALLHFNYQMGGSRRHPFNARKWSRRHIRLWTWSTRFWYCWIWIGLQALYTLQELILAVSQIRYFRFSIFDSLAYKDGNVCYEKYVRTVW